MNIKDLTGQRFGRLTVIKQGDRKGYWKCKCDCGNEKDVFGNNLIRGLIQSCGCLRKETSAARLRKHGCRAEKLYARWKSMKERCADKSNTNYGGKGVTVCKQWENDYITFKTWALQNGYSPELEIDRKDGNGNYEPNNCRWVTRKENGDNRDFLHRVEVTRKSTGEIFLCNSASEAARRCRTSPQTVIRSARGAKTRNCDYIFKII